jgi:transposase
MAIIFTPEFFKEQFRNGKTIRQISTENYVSPSYVSHIVNGFEKAGMLTKMDRCVVPPALLTALKDKTLSYYEAEKITGKSYRYLKRYADMLDYH